MTLGIRYSLQLEEVSILIAIVALRVCEAAFCKSSGSCTLDARMLVVDSQIFDFGLCHQRVFAESRRPRCANMLQVRLFQAKV